MTGVQTCALPILREEGAEREDGIAGRKGAGWRGAGSGVVIVVAAAGGEDEACRAQHGEGSPYGSGADHLFSFARAGPPGCDRLCLLVWETYRGPPIRHQTSSRFANDALLTRDIEPVS